jgi:uridine kinase
MSEREAVLRRSADEILEASATRVAIDGVDGAGKTTFADELADALAPDGREVIRVSADDFLNPRAVRYAPGRWSPEGFFLDSYDYAALDRCVLRPLAPGGSRRFRRRAFDLEADAPLDAPEEIAAAGGILVLDGLFLHRDEPRGAWDYSVFLDVAFAVSVARCAARGTTWASPDVDAPSNRRYVGGQEIYLSQVLAATPGHPRDRQQRAGRPGDHALKPRSHRSFTGVNRG